MLTFFVRSAILALMVSFLFLSCGSGSSPKETPNARVALGSQYLAEYRTWLLDQGNQFLIAAEAFSAAVISGDREKAKALYAPSRMYFERIEPIAEALGDFDPRLDAREGDVPEAEWRGYHKLEQILWSDTDLSTGKDVARILTEDVKLLRAKLETAEITVTGLIAGSVELLNEVSTSKVTGEEERYSHTDLWDFQANVEGAEKIYQILRSDAQSADPELVKILDQRFGSLLSELTIHRKGDGFKYYGELKPAEVKRLVQLVDGLAEPLAQLGKIFKQA